MIEGPYLLFLGNARDRLAAKVAYGIYYWRSDLCAGQLRMDGCNAELDNLPNMNIMQAKKAGVKTLIVAVANRGGVFQDNWKKIFIEALDNGINIASGLHNLLNDDDELVKKAKANNCHLIDVRIPKIAYPIANALNRGQSKRILTIGTDCSVGKMYTSLQLVKELNKYDNISASFRATGQTGILIAGDGVPLDAVKADFMAGALEYLTPANSNPNHFDIVEGQGSLYHISYSGITLAMIHGCQPHGIIICHEPTRTHMRGLPHYPIPNLKDLIALATTLSKIANQNCQVIGISVNTQLIKDEKEALSYIDELTQMHKLPVTDPIRFGASKLCQRIIKLS